MNRLHVLILCPAERFGGAEVYLVGLIEALGAAGHRVTAVVGTEVHHRLAALPRAASATLVEDNDIVWDWSVGPVENIQRQQAMLAGLLDRLPSTVDVVPFVNLNWLSVGTGLLAELTARRLPSVALVHLCPHPIDLTDAERMILRASMRGPVRWVCVSRDNRFFIADSLRAPEGDIRVVHNGPANTATLDDAALAERRGQRPALRARYGFREQDRIVLTVGRHDTQKGFEEAIAVLRDVARVEPDIHYVWVGGGRCAALHEALVRHNRLQSLVTLVEETDQVDDYFLLADLFYFPTKYEGFSLALVEAASFGLPIIANDVSSVGELLDGELSRGLCRTAWHWQHVECMVEMLRLPPEQRAAIGTATRARAKSFSRDHMYSRMMDIITKSRDSHEQAD
ncbi:glycosyltransferase family 4 protein [Azospirillum argentinense]